MTGLFFAVDPVWWIATFDTSSILISLALGVLLGLFFWIYHHFQNRPQPTYHLPPMVYSPIDTAHPDYASLTLIEIRKYLSYQYYPHHAIAHTPQDIASYISDASLIGIMRQLEHSEYTQTELSRDEKEDINRELNMKMDTKTKNKG